MTVVGIPFVEILKIARDLDLPMIVMGIRGQSTPAEEILFGSTAEKVFVDREEGVGGDDHEPFIREGVAAVDLIQLGSYPYWHKADDTIDKVSPQSMKIVGDTVLASLPKIVERVMKEQKEK
jgi:hypothetical protein